MQNPLSIVTSYFQNPILHKLLVSEAFINPSLGLWYNRENYEAVGEVILTPYWNMSRLFRNESNFRLLLSYRSYLIISISLHIPSQAFIYADAKWCLSNFKVYNITRSLNLFEKVWPCIGKHKLIDLMNRFKLYNVLLGVRYRGLNS